MARSARIRGLESLGDLLRRQGGLRPPRSAGGPPIALAAWEAAVGSRIAARTRPLTLERGTLKVLAGSPTWAQELSLLSETIVEQLKSVGLRVDRLRFQVGEVEPLPSVRLPEEVRWAPPPQPLPPELALVLMHVEHEGLRGAIARAASRVLAIRTRQAALELKHRPKASTDPALRPRRTATPAPAAASEARTAVAATREGWPSRPEARPTASAHATRGERGSSTRKS